MPATPVIPEKLDLPTEGAHVEFWSPEDLSGKDHREAMNSVQGDPDNPRLSMAVDLMYSLACTLIKSWTIPYTPKGTNYPAGEVPIPAAGDVSVLESLRLPDYSAIMGAVAPAMKLFNAGRGTPDEATVPGSPTVPSTG